MSSSNFQSCLDFVLKFEGGRSEDPRDPGGRTNEGITEGTYSAWLKKKGRPDEDVFRLSNADRDAIYKEEFWTPIQGDKLRPGEDLAVFDFAVNSGPHRALEIWREAGGGTGKDAASVIKDVCADRLAFLKGLRTWQYFGAGWQKRVSACKTEALKMALSAAPASPPGPVLTGTGAVLTGAGAVINYLQTEPSGQALVLVLAGVAVMFVAMFARWKAPEADAKTSVPANIPPYEELAQLLEERAAFLAEIDPKILAKDAEVKLHLADIEKLLGRIPDVMVAKVPPPAVSPPSQI